MKNNSTLQDTATQATTRLTFDERKRAFETAFANGGDYSNELTELATAIATACLNKCLDPQRTTAGQHSKVSDNGFSPALVELKRGIGHDRRTLENTRRNINDATDLELNQDGDLVTVENDHDAKLAVGSLVGETISDGFDLVQTAAMALLEQASERASGGAWLDEKYTVRRLSKKVYIQATDSAKYADCETTPIQEIYRTVRRAIMASRATQRDPRNGYTYIESLADGELDTIYFRLQKYADLGGQTTDGTYTGDIQTYTDYNDMIDALELTARQLTVVNLRMRGYGYKAIASYLGIDQRNVVTTLSRIQSKAVSLGICPN